MDDFDKFDDVDLADLLRGLSDEKMKHALTLARALKKQKKYNRLAEFAPYARQWAHYALGQTRRERLLTAGNQQGKTEAGAAEMAYHLTGLYPGLCPEMKQANMTVGPYPGHLVPHEPWSGRTWSRPVRAWACGETSKVVRNTIQKKLMGEPGVDEDFGAGLIPKKFIVDKSLARGETDAYDTIQVRHVSGGISILAFKSYDQGRARFQGDKIDFVWDDEEPPKDVYSEQLARITATEGMISVTFTSMKGDTEVTDRFKADHPERAITTMGLRDAVHIRPERYASLIAQYPKHEVVSRIEGGIMRGVGRVFPFSEEAVSETRIREIPEEWYKLWGLDFGIGHPFAAVLAAHDRDADVIHVLRTIRMVDALPLSHSVPIKMIGADVPVAWPQDGTHRDKGSGEPLAKLYKAQGLRMLPAHATFPDGSISTEAGILEMQQRIETGRLKVAADLADWFDEFRGYHRDADQQIVKVKDDIMSATRVAVMAKRFAKQVQLGSKRPSALPNAGLATGIDFDVFA